MDYLDRLGFITVDRELLYLDVTGASTVAWGDMIKWSCKAKFKDGYTEYGTYRVKDDELILKARDGSERKITDRVIAFNEERKAQIVKTDFSDSAKIIGEFNVNDENILEITDRELRALNLEGIHETIDNPYAWEILKAILTEKAE